MGDHTYRWCDVVAFARASGEWEAIGLAAARPTPRVGTEPLGTRAAVDHALEQLAAQFRRDRNLLAADELVDWLDHWGILFDDWLACLRGSILAAGGTNEPGSWSIHARPAGDQATWTEALCSGALRSLAGKLATGLAARAGVGNDAVDPASLTDPATVMKLAADTDRYVAGHFSEAQLEIEVHNHRLDWTLVSFDIVIHDREEVLREIAMCVRHDGLTLPDAASRAGLATSPVWTRVVEVDPGLRGHVAATGPQELIGPVAVPGGMLLGQVIDRAAPSLTDPDTRSFARTHAAQRAVAVVIAEQVVWHDHL